MMLKKPKLHLYYMALIFNNSLDIQMFKRIQYIKYSDIFFTNLKKFADFIFQKDPEIVFQKEIKKLIKGNNICLPKKIQPRQHHNNYNNNNSNCKQEIDLMDLDETEEL